MKTITTLAALLALGACTERTDLVDRDGAADAPTGAAAACDGRLPVGPPSRLSELAVGISAQILVRCNPVIVPLRTFGSAIVTTCSVIERPAPGTSCDPAHGRHPRADGTCLVDQVAVPFGEDPPIGSHGFYHHLDTAGSCPSRIEYTDGDEPAAGAEDSLHCVRTLEGDAGAAAAVGTSPVGGACDMTRERSSRCPDGVCPLRGTEIYAEINNRHCQSGVCTSYRWSEETSPEERDRHMHCNCRCGVPDALRSLVDPATLCACPTGFACTPMLGEVYGPELAGSYCVRPELVSH